MAYTENEKRMIFECLECPFSTAFFSVDGMGAIGAETDITNASTGQAKTQILAWLAAMDSDSILVVQALVVEWIAVRQGGSTTLVNGGVGSGGVSGVNYDPYAAKKSVKDRMMIFVPFYRFHEVLARRAGAQNSVSIPQVW